MTLPGWLYWFTYILVPIVAGILAVARTAIARWAGPRAERLDRYERWTGRAVLACGLLNGFDLVRMVSELNAFGVALSVLILTSQFGLWLVLRPTSKGPGHGRTPAGPEASGPRRAPVEAILGVVAISTAVAMLFVRAQVVWIFG